MRAAEPVFINSLRETLAQPQAWHAGNTSASPEKG
jgi:hypothetical protein